MPKLLCRLFAFFFYLFFFFFIFFFFFFVFFRLLSPGFRSTDDLKRWVGVVGPLFFVSPALRGIPETCFSIKINFTLWCLVIFCSVYFWFSNSGDLLLHSFRLLFSPVGRSCFSFGEGEDLWTCGLMDVEATLRGATGSMRIAVSGPVAIFVTPDRCSYSLSSRNVTYIQWLHLFQSIIELWNKK